MKGLAAVPPWLSGAWKRLYITNGEPPDRSVHVRNIQTPTIFGDCRIPRDRPRFPDARSLADLSDEELTTLYPQNGFAGFTTVDGLVTTWHHEIDYQPPYPGKDIGRLQFTGGRNMFEHGVESEYTEHWWYLASGQGDFVGVRVWRTEPGCEERVDRILSVAGDHFIYARNHPTELPQAPSLEKLIESTKATREQILEYLDCEISHGFVRGGEKPWQIQFSTLPFKEGETCDFVADIVVDPQSGELSPRAERPGERWTFPVNTLAIEDLVVLFPPDPKSE